MIILTLKVRHSLVTYDVIAFIELHDSTDYHVQLNFCLLWCVSMRKYALLRLFIEHVETLIVLFVLARIIIFSCL